MPLGSLFKNTFKMKKCQKSREIAIFGRPSNGISHKIETLGGHISSTAWSWKVRYGSLDAPMIPLQKSIMVKKVTRGPIDVTPSFEPQNHDFLEYGGELGAGAPATQNSVQGLKMVH
jgi:hypothetical protein